MSMANSTKLMTRMPVSVCNRGLTVDRPPGRSRVNNFPAGIIPYWNRLTETGIPLSGLAEALPLSQPRFLIFLAFHLTFVSLFSPLGVILGLINPFLCLRPLVPEHEGFVETDLTTLYQIDGIYAQTVYFMVI